MRPLLVLLVTVALASASGCFGRDDDGGDTTPTPTPTGSTPMTPTGATPTVTPTGPTPTPEPERPAPREVFTGTANFQRPPNPDPAAPSVVTPNPFSVPAGYTGLILNVTWTMGTPAGITNGVSVTVTDAAGTALLTCSVADGPHQAAPAACTMTGSIPATGGEFSANYNGEGTMGANVQVVAT